MFCTICHSVVWFHFVLLFIHTLNVHTLCQVQKINFRMQLCLEGDELCLEGDICQTGTLTCGDLKRINALLNDKIIARLMDLSFQPRSVFQSFSSVLISMLEFLLSITINKLIV